MSTRTQLRGPGRIGGIAGLLTLLMILALSAGASPAPTPASAAALSALSTISGSVTRSGAAVADAKVVAARSGLVRSAATLADGSYSIAGLPDGDYSLSVRPAAVGEASPDWVFTGAPLVVVVPPDAAGQDLIVEPATVTVTGSLAAPAGEPFTGDNAAWVRAENQEGQGNTVAVAADGSFTIKTIPGPILIRVTLANEAWDESTAVSGLLYLAEAGDSVQVDAIPATAALDPIQIAVKSAQISGTVTVLGSGAPAAGIPVRAWRVDGAEFVQALSDGSGSYTLPVLPGAWFVRAVPGEAQAYVPAEPPARVLVDAGATATRNLTVAPADITVTGHAVDSVSGEPIATLDGRVYSLYRGSDGRPEAGPAAALSDGSFSLKLSSAVATTYTVGLYLSPDVPYSALSRVTLDTANVPADLKIPVAAHNSHITGTLRTTAGEALTGVAGAIYGASDSGAWARARVNPATGAYDLPALSTDLTGRGGSTWLLRAFVDPSSGYFIQRPRAEGVFLPYNSGAGSTVADIDFTAVALAELGQVTGRVLRPNGAPVAGVRVSLSPLSGDGPTRWDYTNLQGQFRLRAPAGTYMLAAHDNAARPPAARLIEPAPQAVVIIAQENATADLTFRTSDATQPVTVTYSGGDFSAIVRARSADGATINARVQAGAAELHLLSGVAWTLEAVGSQQDTFLRSERVTLTPAAGANSAISLALEAAAPLPKSQIFAFDAAADQIFLMADGSEVQAPAGAFAEAGTVVLTVRPLPELESVGDAQPVSFGYRLNAYVGEGTQARQRISHFLRPVVLQVPYSDAQLAALGISAEQLVPAYWDEASASWKPVDTVAVIPNGVDGGVVQITTDHFTDFALLADSGQVIYVPLVRR